MSLDPRFVIAPSLEMLFVDKDTAFPMAAGNVYFYEDTSRSIKKPVYQISGTPPNYVYTELPNPIILNSDGSFSDNEGNNVIPYYFPYQGTPEQTDGSVLLYYVVVTNSEDIPQFTREGWPNFIGSGGNIAGVDFTNYIPNGQLRAHTDIPPVTGNQTGQVTQPITYIAQGGFSFERPAMTTSTDLVVFNRIGSYVTNPPASPRYQVEVTCQIPNAGDGFKDIRIRFDDVNKFASDTQEYTFAVDLQNVNLGTIPITLYLIKNFGSGGSTTTETAIATFDVNATDNTYFVSFTFGDNTGKTIGTLNDDYLQLALRCPTASAFSVLATNFILTPGVVVLTTGAFPTTTDREFDYQAITPPTPNPDGSNLYLPLVLTQQGLAYDDSQVSNILASSKESTSPSIGELFCDGTKYEYATYSADGIPYFRLGNKLFQSFQYKWGSGLDYSSGFLRNYPSYANIFDLFNNTAGSVTATADGAGPLATGFTFATTATGTAGYDLVVGYGNDDYVYFTDIAGGIVTPPTAGTSGFGVTVTRESSPEIAQSFYITVVGVAGGAYFTFSSNAGAFYVWYKVSGSGSDPAPGGTGILVNLDSGDNVFTIAQKTAAAVAGFQCSEITVIGTVSALGGKYFTFHSTGAGFYVWYTVDGVGTDPAPGGGLISIKVPVLSADTTTLVSFKTVVAINQKYYAVPDFRGYYMRGADPDSLVDPGIRFWLNNPNPLSDVGSVEGFDAQQHNHEIEDTTDPQLLDVVPDTGASTFEGGIYRGTTVVISYSGGTETRTVNKAVNFFIKY